MYWYGWISDGVNSYPLFSIGGVTAAQHRFQLDKVGSTTWEWWIDATRITSATLGSWSGAANFAQAGLESWDSTANAPQNCWCSMSEEVDGVNWVAWAGTWGAYVVSSPPMGGFAWGSTGGVAYELQ
jgi:hypothetical protein